MYSRASLALRFYNIGLKLLFAKMLFVKRPPPLLGLCWCKNPTEYKLAFLLTAVSVTCYWNVKLFCNLLSIRSPMWKPVRQILSFNRFRNCIECSLLCNGNRLMWLHKFNRWSQIGIRADWCTSQSKTAKAKLGHF